MANFGQLVLTNVGIQEQYKAQAGGKLKFKRIAMGSGTYTGNILSLTKLVKENVSVAISDCYVQNNSAMVEGFFSNDGLTTGFAWREIGLFVEDEKGNEVLYCYANAGDTYDYIPATEDERYSKYIRIATAIGNATNISIVESEGILYVDTVTFKNLADKVDEQEPSKEKIGNVLFLDGSAEAPFVGMSIFGKSEQIATTGKNLLPSTATSQTLNGVTFSVNADGSVTANGTSTVSEPFRFLLGEVELPAGNYLVTGQDDGASVSFLMYSTQDGTFLNQHSGQDASLVLTETTKISVYMVIFEAASVTSLTVHPMIRIANTNNTYEPYSGGTPSPSPEYPQEIVNIGDSGNIGIDIRGKNLIINTRKSWSETGGITFKLNSDGSITVNGTATETAAVVIDEYSPIHYQGESLIASIGNTSRKVSLAVGYVRENGTVKDTLVKTSATDAEFSYPEEAVSTRTYIFVTTGVTCNNEVIYPMIRLKSTSDEFEKSKGSQTMSVPITNELAGIPVSSGGNYTDSNGQQWICDEIDLERGKLIKRLAKTTFNGSEVWYLYNNTEQGTSFYTRIEDAVRGYKVSLCNKFKNIEMSWINTYKNDYGIYSDHPDGANKYFRAPNASITTLDQWKSWLASNPVELTYILSEPIETSLTDAEIAAYKALHSNNPSTTIFNDAGADMNVNYITKAFERILSNVQTKITSGTNEPSGGSDGDVYIQIIS